MSGGSRGKGNRTYEPIKKLKYTKTKHASITKLNPLTTVNTKIPRRESKSGENDPKSKKVTATGHSPKEISGQSREETKGVGDSHDARERERDKSTGEVEFDQSLKMSYVPQEGCVWNCTSQSTSVEITTLYTVKEAKFSIQFKTEKTRFETTHYPIAEETKGDIIWSGCLPRSLLDSKMVFAHLKIYKSWFKWDYEFESPPLDLQGSYNHFFIFDDIMPGNKYARLPRPHACLFRYANWLFQSFRLQAFPELVEQFPNISISQPEEVKSIYELCERHISHQQVSMESAGYLLGLIGTLQPTTTWNCVNHFQHLLKCVDTTFFSHLNVCERPKFVKAVKRGLGYTLVWSQQQGEKDWVHILQLVRSDAELFRDLLSNILDNLSLMRSDHQEDRYDELSPEEQKIRITKLLGTVSSIPELFRFISVIYQIFPSDDPSNREIVKSSLLKINSSNKMMERDITEILNLMKDWPMEVKEFVYQSGMPDMIAQFLRGPSGANLALYKRLLDTEFDHRLMKETQRKDIYLKLANERTIGLVKLIREFELTEDQIQPLFQDWVKVYQSNYNQLHFMQEIDREIGDFFKNTSLQALAKSAVDHTFQLMNDRDQSILVMIETIDSLRSLQFRQLFMLTYKEKSGPRSRDLTLETLTRKKKDSPDSWTINELLVYLINDTTPPQYEDVEMKLLMHEAIKENWSYCIKQFGVLSAYSYSTSLLTCVEKFATSISDKSMKIEKLLQIQKKSEEGRLQLCAFVKDALSIHFSQRVGAFEKELMGSLQEVQCIGEFLNLCEDCLKSLLAGLVEKKQVLRILAQYKSTYQGLSLSIFKYPPELEILQRVAQIIGSFGRSDLFTRFMMQSTDPLALANVVKRCKHAKVSMLAYLNPLVANVSTSTAEKILAIFVNCKSWDYEIKLLKEENPVWEASLESLSEFMKRYRDKDTLKEICKSVANMSDQLHISVENMHACQIYLEEFSHLETTQVSRVIELIDAAKAEICPASESGNGDLAIQILTDFQSDQEFIKFINNLSDERLKYMLECVNDYDESTINAQTVMQLESVWNFWMDIKGQPSYQQIFRKIQANFSEPKYAEMKSGLKSCLLNLRAFQELSTDLERKDEAKRKQMEALYHNSTFTFRFAGEMFEVDAQYMDTRRPLSSEIESQNAQITKTRRPLGLSDLAELKDRASLTIHAAKTDEERANSRLLRCFVNLVKEVQATAQSLEQLQNFGYCENLTESQNFTCTEGKFDELTEFRVATESKLGEWRSIIQTLYKTHHMLTYIYGSQFWELYDYLIGKSSSKKAANILAFMKKEYKKPSKWYYGTNLDDRLKDLAKILNQLPALQNVTFEMKYTVSPKALIEHYQGQVLYLQTERTLHGLLSLYLHTDKSVPSAAQVLFCTHTTSWPELQAFLYRCFTSPREGELYTLVNGDRLPLETQTEVRSLFHELSHKPINPSFGFALLTGKDDCLLAEYFQQLEDSIIVRETQLITDDVELGRIIKQIDSRETGSEVSSTVVVTSEAAGMGKTSWIAHEMRSVSKEMIVNFPIAGDLDFGEVCKRMLKQVKGGVRLHITLSHVDSFNLLNDLLTFLIIFRTLRTGMTVVVVPSTVRIFIEVQNLQPRLLGHLPVLSYLTQKQVTFNLKKLRLENDATLLGRYLYLYKLNKLDDNPMAIQVERKQLLAMYDEYFAQPQKARNQEISYLAVAVFVRIMIKLIDRFNNSVFNPSIIQYMVGDLRAAGLRDLCNEYRTLRVQLFKGLLQTAEEMTTRCVASVRSTQRSAVAEKLEMPDYEQKLGWEQSNHFCFFFLNDYSHCAVYRNVELVPDALQKLLFIQENCSKVQSGTIQSLIKQKKYGMEDYSSKSHVQLLEKLQVYAKPGTNLAVTHRDAEYVMTPDNFLKMHLINLRAEFELPIIIMGETGCGKSSLVRFFVVNVLGEKFTVLNIHAGITSAKFSEDFANVARCAQEDPSTRVWVFFDEFNTSDCVGQITEILCERKFYGTAIPANIVAVAACNPYRIKPDAFKNDNVGIKKSSKYKNRLKQNLMHLVKPLPETCMEFIWDFGSLTQNDTMKYVHTMVKRKLPEDLVDLFTSVVCASQQYFQEKEDVSSVSLRDVARFVFLYDWLFESISKRLLSNSDPRYQERAAKYELRTTFASFRDLRLVSGVLALCSCYYYRLAMEEQRADYLKCIERVSGGRIQSAEVKAMLTTNENDFIARMELPEGVALNQAFRENISCIINCIFSRIALFICGKPGCSKSLAIQVVLLNFRGDKSQDSYFKTLPELVMVPFQGSESCTSDGILKVFEKAKRFLKGGLNILPVVIFDEIGLAEISKHNPLKVLHSLLELENRDVAFVGISNWRLDASKMNRAMYLARPDPGVEELKHTALSIYNTIRTCDSIETHKEILCSEAVTYYQYKESLKENPKEDADFYGLRDFYHLIKQTASELSKDNGIHNPHQQASIVKRAFERNFGGKPGAVTRLHQLFAHNHKIETIYFGIPSTSTVDLIYENLRSPGARYLMLICSGEIATYALDRYLKQPERRVLVGSRMPGDDEGQEYSIKQLSDIILYMERGISLVLKDLDYIYSSLYDLFNQNFSEAGGRKYCRVALGAQFNPRCFVHNEFHAIVFLAEDRLEETDAPFLNRFEKHRLEIDQMLNDVQLSVFDEMKEWIMRLVQYGTPGQSSQRNLEIQLSHVFPLYSEDYLKLMILFQDLGGKTRSELTENCKKELIYTATEEFLLVLHVSGLDLMSKEQLYEQWCRYHGDTFEAYLQTFCSIKGQNQTVVFTYDCNIIQTESLPVSVTCQHFSSLKREQELIDSLAQFDKSDSQLYILDFNLARHGQHLSLVKFSMERYASEHSRSNKKLCLLIRMVRNVELTTEVCWFSTWDKRSFSAIHPKSFRVTTELMRASIPELICSDLFKFEEEIGRMTLEAFQKMSIQADPSLPVEAISQHISLISEGVGKSPNLIVALKEKILNLVRLDNKTTKWVEEVLYNSKCVKKSSTLLAALRLSVEAEILKHYPTIIFAIEKCFAFRSFFTETQGEKALQEVWLSRFSELKCDYTLNTARSSNKLELKILLDFPFSFEEFNIIEALFKEYENHKEEASSKKQYLKQYRKQSIIQSESICAEPDLMRLYLKDLNNLSLSDKPGLRKYEEFIWKLHQTLSSDDQSLAEKVFSQMDNRNFVFAICEVLRVLENVDRHVFEEVNSEIANLDSLLSHASEIEERPSEQESDLPIEEEEQQSDEEELPSALIRCKKRIMDMISKAIRKLTSNVEQLQAANEPKRLAAELQSLANVCEGVSTVNNIEIDGLINLQLWAYIIDVISQSTNGSQLISQIKILPANASVEMDLFNLDVAGSLIQLIEENCPPEPTQRFKSVYFINLFLDDISCLHMIVEAINKPSSPFWRFSASLVGLILETAELLQGTSNNPFFEENDNNVECLKALEAELTPLDSQFTVLCSDFILRYFTKEKEDDNTVLVKRKNSVLRPAIEPDNRFPRITELHNCANTRLYIEAYCRLLVEDPTLSAEESTARREVDRWLDEKTNPQALYYAIKYIKNHNQWTISQLAVWMKTRPDVLWLSNFNFSNAKDLHCPAISEKGMQIYNQTSCALEALLKREPEDGLLAVLNRLQSGDDRAAFATAMLHWSIRETEGNKQLLTRLGTLSELLDAKLGRALHILMEMLLTGFRDTSPLAITENKGLNLILCLIQILSRDSSLRSVFFNDQSQIHADLTTRLRAEYVYGVGIQPLYSTFAVSKDNFDVLTKSLPKWWWPGVLGRANVCSCGYMYFIGDCGGAMVTMNCPICEQLIGGANHVLLQREGHHNLNDEDAFAYLNRKIDQYLLSQESGLCAWPVPFWGSVCYRQIQTLTHNMLHLLLYLLLHFLQISGMLKDDALAALFSPPQQAAQISDILTQAVTSDYSIVSPTNIPDVDLWWLALAGKLRSFSEQYPSSVVTLAERTALEKDFDILIRPFMESPATIIYQEKQRIEETKSDTAILEEVERPIDCTDMALFRIAFAPSFDDLKTNFERQGLQEKYPLVHLYLQMSQELSRLHALSPIVELTNYLLDSQSHRLRRDEANRKLIAEMIRADPRLKELYLPFKAMWNEHVNIPLQNDCQTLSALNMNSSRELCYFLPDKLQKGGGLYQVAALRTLADIQNRALSGYQDYLTKKTGQEPELLMDLRQYPVQRVKPQDVISDEEIDWTSCYVNNWEYGKGSEVIYNYEKLQKWISISLSKGKFLSTEHMKLIKYRFEMMHFSADNAYSDLITTIRKNLPQQALQAEEMKKVQQSLALEDDEAPEQRTQELLTVYEGLERLLCFLQYSDNSPDTPIRAFAAGHSRYGLHEKLTQPTLISQLPLKHVIALYELLEIELFPYIKTFVQENYKQSDNTTKQLLQALEWKALPSMERVQLVVLRMIVRLLVCGGIDETQALALYVVRPDFWEVTESMELVDVLAERLGEIPLAHSLQVYDFLEEEVQRQRSSSGSKRAAAVPVVKKPTQVAKTSADKKKISYARRKVG